jgi:hypothetical protein
MNKKNHLIYISVLTFLFIGINNLLSQQVKVDTITTTVKKTISIVTVRTVPKFILKFNASYLSGSMELSGHNGGFSMGDFEAGKSFCARNGFGFNLTGMLPLHKAGHFWLDLTAHYNRFVSNLIASNTQDGKVYYNVFGGGLGVDYMFTPTHKVKYFVGANSLFSVIGGNATLYFPDAADSALTVKINSGFRIGYSVYSGMEYAFDKDFGLNVGLKFSHLNLLLKNTSTVTNSSTTDLNDNSLNTVQLYSGWKQFAYFSVYFGFSYYFNVKEVRYKLPE